MYTAMRVGIKPNQHRVAWPFWNKRRNGCNKCTVRYNRVLLWQTPCCSVLHLPSPIIVHCRFPQISKLTKQRATLAMRVSVSSADKRRVIKAVTIAMAWSHVDRFTQRKHSEVTFFTNSMFSSFVAFVMTEKRAWLSDVSLRYGLGGKEAEKKHKSTTASDYVFSSEKRAKRRNFRTQFNFVYFVRWTYEIS